MSINHFLSAMGDKLNGFLLPNQVQENIRIFKAALILVAISLLISSLALLILVVSQHCKKSIKLARSRVSPVTLPRTTNQTK